MTNIEYDYMAKVPSRLKDIEDQLKRIADTLEKLSEYCIAKGK